MFLRCRSRMTGPPTAVHRALGVDWILSGRAGNDFGHLRIGANLGLLLQV